MHKALQNMRVGYFQQAVSDASGAAANAPDDSGIDLWADNQLPNSILLIADVGSVGAAGTLDLILQDSSDLLVWDEDFITIPQITAAGLFFVEIPDPNRYVRLNVTVGTNAVVWSALFLTLENQRLPVTQTGTELTPTYGTGRTPK